jgi:hypothetical protein
LYELKEGPGMRPISHAVEPEEMRDLLERPPRACIVWVTAGIAEVEPVELRFQEGRYWIGVSPDGSAPGPNEPLKLLVDEGMSYFDMRGIWIGGRTAFSEERPEDASPALNWFELAPENSLAWDFGAIRDVRRQ